MWIKDILKERKEYFNSEKYEKMRLAYKQKYLVK